MSIISLNNIVIVNNLLTNIDKHIIRNLFSEHVRILSIKLGENENDRFAMIEFGSDKEASDAVKNVKWGSMQSKSSDVLISNVNEEEMKSEGNKYTFKDLSDTYGNLICEKILEARNLLNSQKAKLSNYQSMKSDEKSSVAQHSRIDGESTDSSEIENTHTTIAEKKKLFRKKLYPIVRKYVHNNVEQVIGIILCSNITELEKLDEDENSLMLKIEEIMSLIKDKSEQKISGNQNIECDKDIDLSFSINDYNEENLNEITSKETDVMKQLYSKIALLEFCKYLNTENLISKIHLCEKLYPLVAIYAGSTTDDLMQKFLELDNAVLNYLLSNEAALRKKVHFLMQSEMSSEFVKKLGFYAMDAKLRINCFDGIIKNQLNESVKIQSAIIGLQNWMANYSQFLSTLTTNRQNVLSDLDHIVNALHDVTASTNTKISEYSESPSKFGSNDIPTGFPINPICPPIMQPNSMMFSPNYLFRPGFNVSNPCLTNQNGRCLVPVFNNGFRPEHPIYSNQNNINSLFLYPNNQSGFDVNEILKNHLGLQNINEIKENSVSDKAANSEEINGRHNFNNEFINCVSGRENIDRIEIDSFSNYTSDESENEIDEENDSTDGMIDETDWMDESMTPLFENDEKKVKEHNEIYLENLDPDVDKEMLTEIFAQFGDILSIRLMRDPDTHQSLEIAYVTYANHSAAKAAFEQVNFKTIYGKKCYIKWSESDKNVRKSTKENVFIKNLNSSIDTEKLYNLFKSYGEIVSCKVQTDKEGVSQGFAFVRYRSKENAEKAIDKMNGKLIENKTIYVGKFLPKNQRKKEMTENLFTNCYVNNFGTSLDDKSLREMFEVFGEIKNSKVELDENGASKGFGFVSFVEHADAESAIERLNGKIVENRTIYVGRAMKKSERRANESKIKSQGDMRNNIYINKLNKNIDDEKLRKEFSVFGSISSAKVMRNEEDNTSLGYGFVCYRDPKDAATAIVRMNGKTVEGQKIYVNLCQKQSNKVDNAKSCPENSSVIGNVFDQILPYLMASNVPNVRAPFLQNPLMTNPVFPPFAPSLNNVTGPALIPPQPFCGAPPISRTDNLKEYYGNKLYPRVLKHAGNLTGKVVGMILQLDNQRISNLITNEKALLSMIKDALEELKLIGITANQ